MATTDEGPEIRERERIAKEIAKTSEAIRKKSRALKTGKMEEDVALERHFRPIIEPLQKIANHTIDNANSNAQVWEGDSMNTDVGIETLSTEREKREEYATRNIAKRKQTNTSFDHALTPHRVNQLKKKNDNKYTLQWIYH